MRKSVFLILGIIMFNVCHGNIESFFINETALKIIANESLCIEKIEEDKIYFNKERIYPTNEGIYLNLNDTEFVLLDPICTDTHGYYLRVREILNRCPHCGKTYFVFCTNKECPGKRRKQNN